MYVFLFLTSIILLLSAHIVKIARQSQFIEIYEDSPQAALSQALSVAFLLNLVLPLKLGNVFRVFYPKKHLQNGATFSFATVIVDILVDLVSISLIYSLLWGIGMKVGYNAVFYLILLLSVALVIALSFVFKRAIKFCIRKTAELFNEHIRLNVLKAAWFSITSFKDMFVRISKIKFLIYTVVSLALYTTSFYTLSLFFEEIGVNIGFISVLDIMYGSSTLKNPTIVTLLNKLGKDGVFYFLLYIIIPIIAVFVYPYVRAFFPKKTFKREHISLLPQISSHDRLVFLAEYFSSKQGKQLKNYLELNRDVAIIEDYSAGSNAKTILCSKDEATFYRKLSFGKDADKLREQIEWIEAHTGMLPLAKITGIHIDDGVCSYDMPYIGGAVSCFGFVHTMPFNDSWARIQSALDDLDEKLYSKNKRKSDMATIRSYIEDKVWANINRIKEGAHIKPFLKYETVYINGIEYKNLPYFEKYFTYDNLYGIFKSDYYSDIHGDLTIENIICLKDETEEYDKGYYIIDPNTGNFHDSPFLDYAKLLQSVHGGYEFLMNTKSVSYHNDRIDFLFTKSNTYHKIFKKYKEYLESKFNPNEVKSIFYHELVHWLRLLPYKINKNGERSLIFYAGLLMILKDVEDWFENDKAGNI